MYSSFLYDASLYFCDDGGESSVILGHSAGGNFTVLVGHTDLADDETTGLTFGRDAKHMYVCYQGGGWIYNCT
jgi:hypothetical protein